MKDLSSSPRVGQVTVQLGSDSMFLGQTLPIEVRDSSLRLVARASGSQAVDLPVGLYEVSAVLGDGRRHSAVVEVKAGEPTPVRFGLETEAAVAIGAEDEAGTSIGRSDAYPDSRSRFTRSMAIAADGGAGHEEVDEVELLEVDGASVVDQTPGRITFQCAPDIHSVPTAMVRVGTRRQHISLPISPQTYTPSGGCVVKAERTSSGLHGQAWISPERTVANGLQNMLSAGYVLEAARVADDAVDLLRGKYEDPTGAALGALLLAKTGQLQRWESWVENLARDFPWLPDGKVLLAQLRAERGEASDADLGRALDASGQRMLFAETYSILLDLLRRWPGRETGTGRKEAVESLAAGAPYVDREAICLSLWQPSEAD